MKIRTVDNLQDAIDAEMGWRKRELTAIKYNVSAARNFAKYTAMRSGIALLYAHWEGAIKNIATFYLEYISNLCLPYEHLKVNFLAISIKNKLMQFEATNKVTLQTSILSEALSKLNEKSQIPKAGIIRTNSNLNSEVFAEIMAAIGLDISIYESSMVFIDEVLLNMRNKIAHGEKVESLSLDEKRYYEIHEKVFALVEMFSTQVANAAILKMYMA